ncbi:chromate resistance protein [Trinickia terrae]|uniref:Chromate resistance protein n=1 Tax=Trinickia terrae TaxID=2571161 RepID=A0A4U1I5R0_9BURK|nr:chromate resistance protein [Trinickia terrae]
MPDVEPGHHGELCSFDAFLRKYQFDDAALCRVAQIVGGAGTGHLGLTPESAGVCAVSIGISRTFADDHEQLRYGMVVYDAMYVSCKAEADT